MIRKFLCSIGLHLSWAYTYSVPTKRQCRECGLKQHYDSGTYRNTLEEDAE